MLTLNMYLCYVVQVYEKMFVQGEANQEDQNNYNMAERLNLSLFHIIKDHCLSEKNESLYKTDEYMSKTNNIWEF